MEISGKMSANGEHNDKRRVIDLEFEYKRRHDSALVNVAGTKTTGKGFNGQSELSRDWAKGSFVASFFFSIYTAIPPALNSTRYLFKGITSRYFEV